MSNISFKVPRIGLAFAWIPTMLNLAAVKKTLLPKSLQYVLLVAAAMALCWLAFRGQDLSQIAAELAKAKWFWIWAAVFFSLLGHIIRAMRWRLLIEATGEKSSLPQTFVAMMLGYLSNLGIPRLGEFTRCGSLNRLTGISIVNLGGTVLVERMVDILCLILIFFGAIFFAGDQEVFFVEVNIINPFLDFLFAHEFLLLAILFAGCALAILSLVLFYYFDANRHLIPDTKAYKWLKRVWEGGWKLVRQFLQLKQKGLFLLYTLLIWFLYYTGPVCALLALDMGGDQVFLIGLYVFVFGSLARTLPLPGGSAGAYHLIISQLLLIYGFAEIESLGLATLNHATQTLFQLIFGVLAAAAFVFLLRRANWKKQRHNPDIEVEDNALE